MNDFEITSESTRTDFPGSNSGVAGLWAFRGICRQMKTKQVKAVLGFMKGAVLGIDAMFLHTINLFGSLNILVKMKEVRDLLFLEKKSPSFDFLRMDVPGK